ncbi:MAG: hypothetical protein Q8Q92_02365, partial [bacterium]|nr:hypothetical protein [bacterium]
VRDGIRWVTSGIVAKPLSLFYSKRGGTPLIVPLRQRRADKLMLLYFVLIISCEEARSMMTSP